jgi:hypothetical protein
MVNNNIKQIHYSASYHEAVIIKLICVSDPDSIRSVDPDSGSGSRKAKMTHKNRNN